MFSDFPGIFIHILQQLLQLTGSTLCSARSTRRRRVGHCPPARWHRVAICKVGLVFDGVLAVGEHLTGTGSVDVYHYVADAYTLHARAHHDGTIQASSLDLLAPQ